MGIPGGFEWVLILLIVLILFGGKRIPELLGGLGKGIRNFKKGLNSDSPSNAAVDDESAKNEEKKIQDKNTDD